MAEVTGWVLPDRVMPLWPTRVMAVVNLTPDSFYDGGHLVAEGTDAPNVSVAARRCHQLVAQGADVLDVGGESTRPGSDPVTPARQLRRVRPVIERLALGDGAVSVPISIDTRSAAVASAAIEAGASIVNDVSGLADPAMPQLVARTGVGLVLGHLRGEPRTMAREVSFEDLIGEVTAELQASVARAVQAGVERARILVDPGIGFGKTARQSAALVACGAALREATGCGVLIGASRKSFLGTLTGREAPDRLVPSVAAAMVAAHRGANMVRVHDVADTVAALEVAREIGEAWDEHAGQGAAPGGPA